MGRTLSTKFPYFSFHFFTLNAQQISSGPSTVCTHACRYECQIKPARGLRKEITKGKEKVQTHGKHDHGVPFPLDDDAEVEAHLEPAEGLVDEDVADLRRGDEARRRGHEVPGR